MKRIFEIVSLACLALVLVFMNGCSKQDDASSQGANGGENGAAEKLDPQEVRRVLDENIPMLKDDDPGKRVEAAEALGELGGQGKEAVQNLLDDVLAEPDRDSETMEAAKSALKKIGAEAVPLMVEKMAENYRALSDLSKAVRESTRRDLEHAAELRGRDEEIARLREEKSEMVNGMRQLKDSLAQKQADLESTDEKMTALETAQKETTRKLAEADEKVASLQADIMQLTVRAAELETEAELATKTSEKLEKELRAARENLRPLQDELVAAQNGLKDKDKDIRALRDEIARQKNTITQLEARIRELQE